MFPLKAGMTWQHANLFQCILLIAEKFALRFTVQNDNVVTFEYLTVMYKQETLHQVLDILPLKACFPEWKQLHFTPLLNRKIFPL